ncbi:hypothetical protein AS594_12255 [Streptomyces agglomeratus]|uniref:DUF3152 domain-containing protein n=1 Tax=Streptomyces agglomeratus TaxID=285458 RepID=A0A1E5P6H7_9ACTN|nr:DUF3152 domain-containing protein [Streptomyces agglomeratus]OEJ25141.1 hypothetical protein AS594_12255 [Streptomyces agglomeratus]OEJ53370.1 hypothetical protein BGK72_23845 [Streptomyces agglomeratus]
MGRHSRRGPAPKGAAGKPAIPGPAEEAPAGPDAPGGRRGRARTADYEAASAPRRPQERQQQYGGTPAHGVPHVRGGHPEQREPGGGWGAAPDGRYGDRQGAAQGPPQPQARYAAAGARIPGPRQEFVEAFDAPRRRVPATGPSGAGADRERDETAAAGDGDGGSPDTYDDGPARGGKGRAFTGVAAAAVTTVLAVVVAGQVAQGEKDPVAAPAAGDRATRESDASRSDPRPTPSREQAAAAPATYDQQMSRTYPIAPKLTGRGEFQAIGGFDKAPGKGQKYTYRVDVEKGLRLDGALFARAVQETLNDDRSWAHNGAMTFERISSGRPDFVVTLASPGTTGEWCAKSGLDTLSGNVSCDSAATERVMINAFRWAQGAPTFGKDKMFAYRQMLINHEVGHRLGHGHKNCETPGELAPIMQQQTKSLDIGGIRCKPNAWVFPGS